MYDSDLPERFDEMSEERKKYLLNWIKENFIPNQVVLTVSQLYQAKDIIQQNNGMRDILLDIILSCK